eukprot:5801968-Amphidinium_carterae.1
MQCAALLSTNVVRVRELLSQPFRVTVWTLPWHDALFCKVTPPRTIPKLVLKASLSDNIFFVGIHPCVLFYIQIADLFSVALRVGCPEECAGSQHLAISGRLRSPVRHRRHGGLSTDVTTLVLCTQLCKEWESWIPTLFEPVRMQFFVPPVVKKTILFFMREDVDPDASVVMLVGPPAYAMQGVHPGIRGRVWKEVLVFKDTLRDYSQHLACYSSEDKGDGAGCKVKEVLTRQG